MSRNDNGGTKAAPEKGVRPGLSPTQNKDPEKKTFRDRSDRSGLSLFDERLQRRIQ